MRGIFHSFLTVDRPNDKLVGEKNEIRDLQKVALLTSSLQWSIHEDNYAYGLWCGRSVINPTLPYRTCQLFMYMYFLDKGGQDIKILFHHLNHSVLQKSWV